jgi:hypothetical protein
MVREIGLATSARLKLADAIFDSSKLVLGFSEALTFLF